jgi:hypothetical protein
MRWNDLLTESASKTLFHTTTLINATLGILQSGNFKMSSMTGDPVEMSTSLVKGYPYYLSTARSKHNYFAELQYGLQRPGTTTFNLDGDIINRHYKATPVDYFRSGGHAGGSDEKEDRVFSKKPLLPINCVTEIHVYAGHHMLMDPTMSLKLRKVAILAKRRGIPIYFYNHIRYMEDQNKLEALSGKELMTTLGKVGGEITKNDLPKEKEPRKDLKNWVRLLTAKDVSHLAPEQKELIKQIADGGWGDLNLGDTMMYGGKPGSKYYEYVSWLNQYMMKNKIKDAHALVMRIRQKYDLF